MYISDEMYEQCEENDNGIYDDISEDLEDVEVENKKKFILVKKIKPKNQLITHRNIRNIIRHKR